jgi:hypothetical protein
LTHRGTHASRQVLPEERRRLRHGVGGRLAKDLAQRIRLRPARLARGGVRDLIGRRRRLDQIDELRG